MKTCLKTLPAAASAAMAMIFMGGTANALAQVRPTGPMTAQPEIIQGEVIRIDAARNRITLRHARIKSIGMEAMTMPFKVSDAAMLEPLKPGDKVSFSVAMQDDELLITRLSRAKAVK